MAGPLALLKGASAAGKAVSHDLVVIQGQWFRKIRSRMNVIDPKTGLPARTRKGRIRKMTVETLEPVDAELHINPVAIGLGALAIGAAALAGWVIWNGITLGTPFGSFRVFPGLKEDSALVNRIIEAVPGTHAYTCAQLEKVIEDLKAKGRPLPGETWASYFSAGDLERLRECGII